METKLLRKVPADEIADNLYKILVEEEPAHGAPSKFGIPETMWPGFRAKMRLYREAAVLATLLSQAHKETKYEDVLKLFEKRILPTRPTPEGKLKLEALKEAMQLLSQLVDGNEKEKELSWSRYWLTEIGYSEINPVTLTLFSVYWIDFCIGVAKSLKELTPL